MGQGEEEGTRNEVGPGKAGAPDEDEGEEEGLEEARRSGAGEGCRGARQGGPERGHACRARALPNLLKHDQLFNARSASAPSTALATTGPTDLAVSNRSEDDELAVIIRERKEVLEQKRESNAQYREKLSGYDARFDDLATSVEKSTELQDVICIDVLDVRTNVVDVIRTDTGEIVETRVAKKEELQETLFAGNAEAPEAEAPKPSPRRRVKAGEEITAPAELLDADGGAAKANGKKESLAEKVNREVDAVFRPT